MSKKVLQIIFVTIVFLTVNSAGYCDQFAIADNGRKVLLKDDGTWEYVKEDPKLKEAYTFRETKWGMSRQDVKRIEKEKNPIDATDGISYESNVLGLDCFIHYYFTEDDKLALGGYSFRNRYTNTNKHIDDYKRIRKLLIQKYGDPKPGREIIWKNDLYRNKPQDHGMSISMGYHSYVTIWENNDTRILLSLSGNNFRIDLSINYMSVVLKESLYKSKDKSDLDDL